MLLSGNGDRLDQEQWTRNDHRADVTNIEQLLGKCDDRDTEERGTCLHLFFDLFYTVKHTTGRGDADFTLDCIFTAWEKNQHGELDIKVGFSPPLI